MPPGSTDTGGSGLAKLASSVPPPTLVDRTRWKPRPLTLIQLHVVRRLIGPHIKRPVSLAAGKLAIGAHRESCDGCRRPALPLRKATTRGSTRLTTQGPGNGIRKSDMAPKSRRRSPVTPDPIRTRAVGGCADGLR